MTERSLTLLKGTVDLLILSALSDDGPRHGYGVAEWIEKATSGALLLEEGTLYPALHRLRRKGLIESEWGTSENNRRARFYRLTGKGREAQADGRQDWNLYAEAISSALNPGGAG